MRIIAVDWSGKLKGSEESIWQAEIRDGTLVDLQNGCTRRELVENLIDLADDDPHMVVGLDFAFSFPRWWCTEQGWLTGKEVWAAMARNENGENLLAACESPFWGRPGKPNPHSRERLYRRTELEKADGAKSVFQIGGAGAVGTGSIRGMPYLLTLAENGFSIWPFAHGWPRVVEIYPRALTGSVNKSKWTNRHAHLFERFPMQPRDLLERAAGSEDAFDAAVSGLIMGEREAELQVLSQLSGSEYGIEGKIWRPATPP